MNAHLLWQRHLRVVRSFDLFLLALAGGLGGLMFSGTAQSANFTWLGTAQHAEAVVRSGVAGASTHDTVHVNAASNQTDGTASVSEVFQSDPGDHADFYGLGVNSRLSALANAFGLIGSNILAEEGWDSGANDSTRFRSYSSYAEFSGYVRNDNAVPIEAVLGFFLVEGGRLGITDTEGYGLFTGETIKSQMSAYIMTEAYTPGATRHFEFDAKIESKQIGATPNAYGHTLDLSAASSATGLDFSGLLTPGFECIGDPFADPDDVCFRPHYEFGGFEAEISLGIVQPGDSLSYTYGIQTMAQMPATGVGAVADLFDPQGLGGSGGAQLYAREVGGSAPEPGVVLLLLAGLPLLVRNRRRDSAACPCGL